jgi:hypothetical protein
MGNVAIGLHKMIDHLFKQVCLGLLLLLIFSGISVAQTGLITTIAGTGAGGYFGDTGPATAAQLNAPGSLAVDGIGNIYIGDASNHRVRKIDPSGTITTFAGIGVAGHTGDGGPATAAKTTWPGFIAVDGAGNVYIDDNPQIRKIDAMGIITTIGGTPGPGAYSGDGSPATLTTFGSGIHMTADVSGNVYVSDAVNYRVFKFNPGIGAGLVTTIAGTGVAGYSGDNGPATLAQLSDLRSIGVDATGNIFVSDAASSTIRKINTSGVITTYAGNGTAGYSGDGGPATAAKISISGQITFDASGNLYFADIFNYRVRRIDAAGIITTYAGTGVSGFGGDNGPATSAQMVPFGVVWRSGSVYITDGNRVRRIKGLDLFAPSFTTGSTSTLSVCENDGPKDISSMMVVNDGDAGETQTWSLASPPLHGTAMAAYTTTSTGSPLTPTGLSYTPTIGYTGNDSFKVSISDYLNRSDTITIYATVHARSYCHVAVNSINDQQLLVYPNPSKDELNITGIQMETTCKLYNYTGMCVLQRTLQPGSNTICMQRIPAGLYVLELNGSDGERKMIRVVKD